MTLKLNNSLFGRENVYILPSFTQRYNGRHNVFQKSVNLVVYGSIPLNIHEVWPRPFWGEAYRRKKIPVDHFISHIPLLYKKLIKDQKN